MNRRRMVIAGVVAVAVVGVAATAYAINSSGSSASDRYRTTTATRGDLTATVSLSGSLTHVDSVTAAFPASGVVTSVSVHAGQQVTAGEVLATMDTTPLRAALLEAQSQVAAAQLAIEQDRTAIDTATPSATAQAGTAGQGSGASGSAATGTSGAGATASRTGATSTGGSTSGSGGSTGASSGAASKVAASQAEVTKALAAVDEAQKAVNSSCTEFLSGLGQGTADPGPSAAPVADQTTPSPSPDESAGTTPPSSSAPAAGHPSSAHASTPAGAGSVSPSLSASPAPTSSSIDPKALETCMTALSTLSEAQHKAALALDAGATALTQQAQSQAQSQQSAATRTTGSTTVPSTAARSGVTAGQSGQSGQGGTGATSPQAKLLADQGTLAVAQQQQTQAQNNLDAASLTAPISGVVGAVDLSVGNRATPTKGIVIIGPGAAQVDATASLADLQQVTVGDHVQVRTVGSSTALDGSLTAVGALPSSGAGTDAPSYPVVVSVPSGAGGLPEGAPSTASIVTTSLNSALVIPSSALTTSSTGATTVTTLADGATRTVDVSVGARGQGRVQILSGISASDVIVLADLTAPLPDTNLNNARRALGGGSGAQGGGSASAGGGSGAAGGNSGPAAGGGSGSGG